jgi:hypothetical protein
MVGKGACRGLERRLNVARLSVLVIEEELVSCRDLFDVAGGFGLVGEGEDVLPAVGLIGAGGAGLDDPGLVGVVGGAATPAGSAAAGRDLDDPEVAGMGLAHRLTL